MCRRSEHASWGLNCPEIWGQSSASEAAKVEKEDVVGAWGETWTEHAIVEIEVSFAHIRETSWGARRRECRYLERPKEGTEYVEKKGEKDGDRKNRMDPVLTIPLGTASTKCLVLLVY